MDSLDRVLEVCTFVRGYTEGRPSEIGTVISGSRGFGYYAHLSIESGHQNNTVAEMQVEKTQCPSLAASIRTSPFGP